MNKFRSTLLSMTLGVFLATGAHAGGKPAAVDYLTGDPANSPLTFRFQHQRFSDALDGDTNFGYVEDGGFQNRSLLNAYDAAIAYPVWSRGVNVDLGLNIRVLDGQVMGEGEDALALRNFRAAIPMFYATALFDLPFEGLKAGIEGSYGSYDTGSLLTDYRARIQYSLDNGLGIEGGWRRQQIYLDDTGRGEFIYDHSGAFVDFYMNF